MTFAANEINQPRDHINLSRERIQKNQKGRESTPLDMPDNWGMTSNYRPGGGGVEYLANFRRTQEQQMTLKQE